MIDLHDSHGRHIANFVSGQLHDVQGRNIGHYLENEGIFINMQGYYLGEIVDKRRLLYNNNSAYKSICYGVYVQITLKRNASSATAELLFHF